MFFSSLVTAEKGCWTETGSFSPCLRPEYTGMPLFEDSGSDRDEVPMRFVTKGSGLDMAGARAGDWGGVLEGESSSMGDKLRVLLTYNCQTSGGEKMMRIFTYFIRILREVNGIHAALLR
jgi:hypothetical protein